jgi:VCBS repeat-containing protein
MALNFADESFAPPAVIVIHTDDGRPIGIPEAAGLFAADFTREGGDLVLRNAGAPDIRILDYFDGGAPADLVAADGAVLRGATVARLAGPEAPGQYAQAGAPAQAADPIGQVESLSGEATVQRTDGTVEVLGPGAKIFADDVLQTGADGRLSLTFVDGTIFTLSAASRMVVDELIYDPAGQANSGSFDLIQGGFVFIAGQVARTGGMEVTTPSATMGIRGTTVLVEIEAQGGVATAQVTLVRDPDGDVGRVELFDLSQNLIATITEANASWIISTAEGETREVERGSAPDDADSLLISEAVAAYQSAFGRVGQGGSFVELDNVLRGGTGADDADADGIDLDSDDAEELPELAPPPEVSPENDGSFDEGRNGFVPPTIVLTGVDSGRVADGVTDVADGRLAAVATAVGGVLTWSGSAAGRFGSFDISPDGDWRYTAGPAIVELDEGQTAVETFTALITDEAGLTATRTITITVVGAGDAPVSISPASETAANIGEGIAARAEGRLSALDPDAGAVLTWSGSTAGVYGSFAIAPDGTWNYVAGPAARRLAGGETATETFTATVTDQTGRSAIQTVTVTIGGANDAPVPTTPAGDATATLVDGQPLLASGRLTATDPDAGSVLTWSGDAAGAYGTFTVLPNGEWTFSGNGLVQTLGSGATVTETFTATVTDDRGATATQTVVVTIRGANDAPVSSTGDVDTAKDSAVTGRLVASDIDAGDVLTFGAGPKAPSNGTVVIGADGSFSYTPAAGFQGLDSFDFTVSDGQGGTSTSRVTVAVLSPTGSGSGGSSVSIGITGAPGAQPAGTVISTASPVDASGVNLVIALDRSGSIGPSEWSVQINQVADALEALAVRFAGAATSVDVRIVTYASSATATGTFDLTDPALITTVRSLPYSGGGTNYASALLLTEAFFDSQPKGEANFLYFITDGVPTENTWPTVLDRLTDEAAKGYSLQIEAFGIGGQIDFNTLSVFDASPELLAGANALTDAFTATPLFSADLVTLRVELIADGVDKGVIATETSAGVVSSGLVTTLPLAEIAGLADLLGTTNRVSATAGYDLDGDPTTIEVELFASSLFEKAAAAQTLTGTAGSDLLLGSDMSDDLTGGPGNDILMGFGGNDVIRPGAGRDTVLAGAGDDRIVVSSPETGPASGPELLDGGTGRDTLDIDFGGDVNAGLLDLVDLRGIEAIDMQNGQANTLRLALSDVIGMSQESDTDLEALLGGAVALGRTILGDATDTLVLEGARKTGTTADASGNTFDIYSFEGGSDVLATLAVDADMAVSTQAAGT